MPLSLSRAIKRSWLCVASNAANTVRFVMSASFLSFISFLERANLFCSASYPADLPKSEDLNGLPVLLPASSVAENTSPWYSRPRTMPRVSSTVTLYSDSSARYSPSDWKRYCLFTAFTMFPTCFLTSPAAMSTLCSGRSMRSPRRSAGCSPYFRSKSLRMRSLLRKRKSWLSRLPLSSTLMVTICRWWRSMSSCLYTI